MANPMLAELDEVVRLSEKATPGPWLYRPKSNSWHKPPPEGTNYSYGEFILGMDSDSEDDGNGHDEAFLIAAVQFMSTHHATLADMAKRLEAAERDAARYAFLRDDPPVELSVRKREENRRDGNAYLYIDGPELDRQIDAAIDATQEGEG